MSFFSFLFGKNFSFFGKRNVSVQTRKRIEAEWQKIDVLLQGNNPSQHRQALISADKSLDNAMRDLVEGENMGQRLKNAKDLFEWSQYDLLWKAHKMRNNLVHESGFEPTQYMVKEAVENLRNGLKELGLKV